MSNLLAFSSSDFAIRAIDISGDVWFVGRDVALALGYSDTINAIKQHCRGVVKHHPVSDALGRKQATRILSEPDVLRLIVNSTLPAAEKFERWVFEDVLPSIRRTGTYTATSGVDQPLKLAVEAAKAFGPLVRVARLMGCDKNAAVISANQAVMAFTEINLMVTLGQTHLMAANQDDVFYTPTELGSRIGGMSGRALNVKLETAGFQVKPEGGVWEMTQAGKSYGRLFDTMKRHASGTPVMQLKWSARVLEALSLAEVAA